MTYARPFILYLTTYSNILLYIPNGPSYFLEHLVDTPSKVSTRSNAVLHINYVGRSGREQGG